MNAKALEHKTSNTVQNNLMAMISAFNTIDYALFTTFNFSAGFFETNVLPLAAGFSQSEVREKQISKQLLNENLDRTRVVVICDKSTQPEPKGNYNYGLLSVKTENGRFHPKITLLYGTLQNEDKGAYISIGSANLSFSGWGVNKEIVTSLQVLTRNHKEEIERLLNWIIEKAQDIFDIKKQTDAKDLEEGDIRNVLIKLKEYIKELKEKSVDAPQICISAPAAGRKKIIDLVCSSNEPAWEKAYIFSPYWAGMDANLSKINAKKIMIILTRNYDSKFEIELDESWGHQVDFHEHKDDRFSHAKLIILEKKDRLRVVAGSANFTSAALETSGDGFKNIEAIAVFESAQLKTDKLKRVIKNEVLGYDDVKRQIEKPVLEEGAPPLPPFDADVCYDWSTKTCSYSIRSIKRQISNLILKISDTSLKLDTGNGNIISGEKEIKLTSTIRTFDLSYQEDKKEGSFKGLIYHLNADDFILNYYPKPHSDDILNIFRSIVPGESKKANRKKIKNAERHAAEKIIVEQSEEETDNIPFDYFGLYQAFYRLRKYISENRQELSEHNALLRHLENLFKDSSSQNSNQESPEKITAKYLMLLEIRATLPLIDAQMAWQEDLTENISRLEKEVTLNLDYDEDTKSFFNRNNLSVDSAKFLNWCKKELKKADGVNV